MNRFIRVLGSLSFAIFLIAVLAVILTASTLLESAYGTPFVQRFFYQTQWFNLFLALVGINMFCATLTRWPFKKQHTGFLVTHAGILLLLVGSLMSRVWGIDGQLALVEGESRNEILLQGYELAVHTPDHRTQMFDLKSQSAGKIQKIDLRDPELSFFIHGVAEGAEETADITEGKASDPVNHAVRFTLTSQMAGAQESKWLVEKNPLDPQANRFAMGAATIELKEKEPLVKEEDIPAPSGPAVRILQKKTGRVFWIDLSKTIEKETALGETGLKIADFHYYPDARVDESQRLTSLSEKPQNPAVEFSVRDSSGNSRGYTRFLLFPEFEALHGRDGKDIFGLAVDIRMPELEKAVKTKRPGLTFYFSDKGWSYESSSSKGTSSGGVEAGKSYPTGWMDFSFRVDQLLDHAVVERKVVRHEDAPKDHIGVEVSLGSQGKLVGHDWVFPDRPVNWNTAKGPVIVALGLKTAKVPFSLTLKNFRKVDYPGTDNAASYESDVALEDPIEHVTIQKTIQMNKPLDYKGYRIFQSSFSQDPMTGNTSIFTVAKNPGIMLIYSGSVILFIGVFFVFYVRPFSTLNQTKGTHVGKKR